MRTRTYGKSPFCRRSGALTREFKYPRTIALSAHAHLCLCKRSSGLGLQRIWHHLGQGVQAYLGVDCGQRGQGSASQAECNGYELRVDITLVELSHLSSHHGHDDQNSGRPLGGGDRVLEHVPVTTSSRGTSRCLHRSFLCLCVASF